MNNKRVLSLKLAGLATVLFILLSCGSVQQIVQTQANKVADTAVAGGGQFAETQAAILEKTAGVSLGTLAVDAQTQIPQVAGTLAVQAQTEVPQAAGTLSIEMQTQGPQAIGTLGVVAETQVPNFLSTFAAQTGSAPFKPPTFGYLGLKYKQERQDKSGLSNGIDIWAATDPTNGGQRGNPVYAVFGGKLGRTALGVTICHPALDLLKYPGMPFPLVCTFYEHLSDMPAPIAGLKVNDCPNSLVEVKQGDLLGYMDQKDMKANSGVVHLTFGVVQQNPATGCWMDPSNIANTLDPFVYLGKDPSQYSYLSVFP